MCFRPTEIQMKNCTQCGASNKPVATICEACGADLDNTIKDFDADQAALDAAIKKPGTSKPPAPPKTPRPPAS